MPEPLSEEKLAELEGLEKAATPAPWEYEQGRDRAWRISEAGALGYVLAEGRDSANRLGTPANRPLMVEARNALPSLLAEVRIGREALKALEAMEDAYDHVAHCRECGETSVQRCAESEGENSAAAKATIAREECSRVLRKAGLR